MRSTFIKRSVLALAVLAAVVGAIGIGTRSADAQVPGISAGGAYVAVSGQPIQFQGMTAVGPIASASWYFSDGTRLPGLTVVKTFWSAGSYGATLTVTNSFGQTFSTTAPVTIASTSASFVSTTPFIFGTTQTLVTPFSPFFTIVNSFPHSTFPLTTACPVTPVVINGTLYCTTQRGIEIDPRTIPGR